MIWLDTPPMTTFTLISQNKQHVRLEGPSPSARVVAGMSGAFGAGFAAFGVRLLRQRLPMPAALIPIAFTAVGAGLAARGAGGAVYRASIDAKKSGLTFSWSIPPVLDRTLEIPWKDVEDLEINTKEVGTRDELSTLVYTLTLVKKDGTAIPLESFGTRAQATLRKKALESVTRK